MFSSRYAYLILSSIILLAGSNVLAQNIKGNVYDAADSSPLPGAVIKLTDQNGKILSYAVTDKSGAFSVASNPAAEILTVSLLGYSPSTKEKPFEGQNIFYLDPLADLIRESVVRADKVVIAGDTTKYNVMALKTREDLVLGDVLKRIPGIEISPGGVVSVDGKQLGKFYVNGRDILGGNYNLATGGLSVDAVKSLEVIRNHQPMKILQGIKEGEDAAINVLLNDSAKGRINWKGRFSAGTASEGEDALERFPLSGSLTAFLMGGRGSSVSNAEIDSQGSAMAGNLADISNLPFEDAQHPLDRLLTVGTQTAPLNSSRSVFGYDAKARTVNTLSLGGDATVSSSFNYSSDFRYSSVDRSRTYFGLSEDNEEMVVSTVEERRRNTNRLNGNLSFVKNASGAYLSEKVFADVKSNDGESGISGDVSRSLSARGKNWDIGNRLAVQFRSGSSGVLGITSYTQFSGMDERLDIGESSPSQGHSSQAFFEDISLLGLNRAGDHWTFSLRPNLSWTTFMRSSLLSGMEGEIPGAVKGESKADYLSVGASFEASWSKRRFKSSLIGGLHYDIAAFSGESERKIIPDVSIKGGYVSGRWEVGITSSYSVKTTDIQSLGTALILTDFDLIRRPGSSLLFLPAAGITASFVYREPVRGWNLKANTGYSKSSMRLPGRDLWKDYLISYETDVTCPQSAWNSSAQLSKGFYGIGGNLVLSVSHTRLASEFRNTTVPLSYVFSIITPSAEANVLVASFWRIAFNGTLSFNSIKATGISTSENVSASASLTNSFYLTDKLSLNILSDIFHSSSLGKTAFFQDMSISWTVGKCRLKAIASNLFDIKEYSWVTLSPLMESAVSCRIRPLTFLIGVDLAL